MAIKVSQAFERTSANPVDVTLALTKAQMLTVNDNLMPAYYFTICQDDGYIYLYDKTATPTVTTGKFTKFEGSGGGGSGSGGTVYTSTLLASGWNAATKEQTVTFTGYDEDYAGVIGVPSTATDAQRKAYADAQISVVSQTGATVTVKVNNTVPTIDIPVIIYCGGGSGSGVPDGGTTGQALVKKSNTDGDVEWKTISGAPSGGQTGQVLTKNSNTSGDVSWKTPSSIQYGTMPIASFAYKDKIVQYVGATTGSAPIYKNGYFYKCIENTSVTPYIYSWQEIEVSEDKEGHTILDTDGNAKTQRGKLQFIGLDVADDAINSKTEVKPFGLNSDDLDEIIDTSEISNGYVQSQFNYSLEEQVIGKWVDGKPVYQKTIACGTLPNNTTKTVSHNISNIDYIIKWTGSASDSTGIHIKFPYINILTLGKSCNVWIDKTAIGIETASDLRNYTKSYITLQYTKTKD